MNQQAFAQSRSNGSTPIRVLMADPDPSLPPVYREPLLREGFELATEPAGWSASLGCARVPDVLVLEPQMPWGGGEGVLAIMDESPDLAMVPVMILTAYRDPHVLQRVERFSISDYHVKPLAPDPLPGRLRSFLDYPRLRFTLGDDAGRLKCAIARQTGGRIRDLRVEVCGGRIIVCGCTESYHVKQLVVAALCEAMEASKSHRLRIESEIEVCGDCQSTIPAMCYNSKKKWESA